MNGVIAISTVAIALAVIIAIEVGRHISDGMPGELQIDGRFQW